MTARSPTMVVLLDTRFVECRWWNDGWTVKTVVTRRSSASMIPAPGSLKAGRGVGEGGGDWENRHTLLLTHYRLPLASQDGLCVFFVVVLHIYLIWTGARSR